MSDKADQVTISREALQRLIDSVEGFWDDHSFAQTSDNPGWVGDRKAIKEARSALRKGSVSRVLSKKS